MIDQARLNELMTTVEQITMEVPRVYRAARGPSAPSLLTTEQQVLQLLRKAARALSEACVLVADDPATFAKLVQLRTRTVERLIESAHTCMALEEAELMHEARGQTLH